jgi:hypothetical protein
MMIGHSANSVILRHRPVLHCPLIIHRLVKLLPYIRSWRQQVRNRATHRVVGIAERAQRCATREELERALGKPCYAISGECFAADVKDANLPCVEDLADFDFPEIIETYKKDGCLIDVWLRDGTIVQIFGTADLTWWDVACHLEEAEGE